MGRPSPLESCATRNHDRGFAYGDSPLGLNAGPEPLSSFVWNSRGHGGLIRGEGRTTSSNVIRRAMSRPVFDSALNDPCASSMSAWARLFQRSIAVRHFSDG